MGVLEDGGRVCCPGDRRIFFVMVLSLSGAARGESGWVEGEDAVRRSEHPHSWDDSVKKEELWGGAWLSNFVKGEGKVGMAE